MASELSVLSVKFTAEQLTWLRQQARVQGRSMGHVLRALIDAAMTGAPQPAARRPTAKPEPTYAPADDAA